MAKGILFTATAAFIGALVYMGVAYVTMYEYDLLAFVIAAGVGVAAMFGFDRDESAKPMVTAFVCAVLALVGGKYFTIEMLYDSDNADAEWVAEAERVANDEEYAITYMADQVIREYNQQGKPVNFPLTANQDAPESSRDYPVDVWNEAYGRWQGMTEAERKTFLEIVLQASRDYVESQSGEIKQEAFADLLDGKAIVLIIIASLMAAGVSRASVNQGQSTNTYTEMGPSAGETDDEERPVS